MIISLLVIFIFSIILVGCNSPTSDKNMYGQLVFDNPDSLLQVVNNIDTMTMNEGDKHLYNLMYTAAMCRTGMCNNDTAVISNCEYYYNENNDAYLLALSQLYHAEIAFNQFDYYKTVNKLMRAIKESRTIDNDALKSDLFNLLYRVNSELDCTERAAKACKTSLDYALKGGLQNQIANAYNSMAAMLITQENYVEAKEYLDSNALIIDKVDKRNKSEHYRIKGLYLMERDSISAAREMFIRSEKTIPTADTFYDIAKMYLKLGVLDSCINYCHFATTADHRGSVSIKAYKIIIENFSNQLGTNTLIRMCNDLNTLYLKRGEVGDVSRIERIQASLDDEGNSGLSWWVIVVIILICTVLFVILYKVRTKRNKDGDKLLMNETIVYDLHKLSQQGRSPSQEQWIALHSAANKHIPFFLTRLHKITDLSAREINICLLTRLHFSPSEIGTLTDISPQSVTNIRSRLLVKVFGIKGGAAEFDRRISNYYSS